MSREVPLCSVLNCPNGDQQKVKSTVFYFVPKDLVRATTWINALKGHISNVIPPLTKILICSFHFEPDAFEPNSKKLKDDAIPSIFRSLRSQKRSRVNRDIPEVKNKRVEPCFKRVKLSNISSLLKTNKFEEKERDKRKPTLHILESMSMEDEDVDVKDEDIKIDFSDDNILNQSSNYMEEVRQLQIVQQNLKDEEKLLQEQEQNANVELEDLTEELKRKKVALQNLPKEEAGVLKKCFSRAQIRLVTGQTAKARWTLADLAMAYTISSLSSRHFYTYLRNDLRYPLPAFSNINRCYKSKYRTTDKKK